MKQYAFGVDVGGTSCKIGLFSTSGTLLEKWSIPTNTADAGSHILEEVAQTLEAKMAVHNIPRNEMLGIGLGVPCPVVKGVTKRAINLGWRDYPVESLLAKRMGMPVAAGNDVNVAFLGEQWMGSAAGCTDGVMVTLGTGVGGAIIAGNQIVAGFGGSGGELGHIKVNPYETETCACGRTGCLEQYASATGIARRAAALLAERDTASTLRGVQPITTKEVFEHAKQGDALAVEIVDWFGRILGGALADIACVVDPGIIVIGGGVSAAGQILLDTVQRHYRQTALYACADAKFVLASLGNDACIYGGVRMLLD